MTTTAPGIDRGWLFRLPKVELHLHLERAIPHDTLWELLRKYGGVASIASRDDVTARFVFSDFAGFIEAWNWKNRLLRSYEDFEFVAAAIAEDLARQNVRYAEVFFSPADVRGAGLEPQRLAESIRAGFDRTDAIEIALIVDLVRDVGPEAGSRMLDSIDEVRHLGIIGVGIGGNEKRFPPEAFAATYRKARDRGYRTSVHAGETAGPESIWGAVRVLEADRIGHGTRAIEDPILVDHLASRSIPIELCMLSNVGTGVIGDVREHPARTYFERGIPLSVNTDDPGIFGNSLVDEYAALHRDLRFSSMEILTLIEQGVETSWLPQSRKIEMLRRFRAEFAAIGLPTDTAVCDGRS
jgi:adenosine deaminase